ncbi:hypothetical protein [Streptomyces sp. NPDC021622]|uniref:hypothetical protein n=1 Tax=Streptomyces sp. NPDC021622 TaxID=3155013 RepID=UPI0033F1034D
MKIESLLDDLRTLRDRGALGTVDAREDLGGPSALGGLGDLDGLRDLGDVTGADGDERARAEAVLALLTERADDVVPALLAGVADANSTATLRPVIRILALIGPPAFDAVLEAWRRGNVKDWAAGRLLGSFDERCADRYAELATDSARGASGNGFAGLVRLRTDSDAGLRALVECYAGRRPAPYEADDYALLTHEAYRTRLRALRRDPAASPRTRRGAMAALVAGGGADGLDARDRAAIERLIRVKIAGETPSAPSHQLSGWWLAVPGASYEGLFDALDLHHRRPITSATGVAAAGQDVQVPVPGGDGAVQTVGRVFVTPELDGWRLVFGPYDLLIGDGWDYMVETVERVSRHCAKAQLFFVDDAGGSDVWFVAEEGCVIRQYAAESGPEWEGDPLPWETLAVDDPDFDPEYDDAPPDAGTAGARTACGHLSVDPDMVGSGTETRGHGWLALTSPHAGHGAFPGILPL